MKMLNRVARTAAIVAMALTTACSSSGTYKKGEKTSQSVMSASRTLDEGSAQIDKVVASLNKLIDASPKTNLSPLFKTYSSNVEKLDSIAKDAKKRADEMKAKGNAYFTQWDAELAKINNEDIKNRSAERRTQVEQAFQRISQKSQTLKDAYQPMMSDLQDIRTALANDLTAGGIASIKPIAARVATEATNVKSAAAALSTEYEALGVKMSPTGK